MRALVTGGAGFIGSHLAEALWRRGDEVVVIDDLSSGSRANLTTATGVELVQTSIADSEAVRSVFESHRPEMVFHLAAQIDVRRSLDDPAYDLGINAGATVALLEEARRAGSRGFVLASTGGAIYGEGLGRNLPLDEGEDCLPESAYGLSKLTAEGYLRLYNRLYGMSTVALRLANVYGPRQDPHGEAGVVAIFTDAMLGGVTPKVFGDGLQTRDYVYVGDVVRAFVSTIDADSTGVFNVGTGAETSVLELGEAIAKLCDRPGFAPDLVADRPGEVRRISIDSTQARSTLGWSPQTGLRDGLAETVAWIRERRDQAES